MHGIQPSIQLLAIAHQILTSMGFCHKNTSKRKIPYMLDSVIIIIVCSIYPKQEG